MSRELLNSKETPDPVEKAMRNQENTQAHGAPPEDFYNKVITYEEGEALERDPDDDFELYSSTTDDFRKILHEIAILKTQNTEEANAQIVEKRIQGSLLFVVLKKLNRMDKLRRKHNQDTLHKARQQIDNSLLQLQNLNYEHLLLKKQVKQCLEFKSTVEEIDLISVEQFYKEAPKSISLPNLTEDNAHLQKLARLEWELRQRQHLESLCQNLQEEKAKMTSEIEKKQNKLDNLATMLQKISAVAEPVQNTLGLVISPSPSQKNILHLLPQPLYFLFLHADAYKGVSDSSIRIEISGDTENAKRLKNNENVITKTPVDLNADNQKKINDKQDQPRRTSAWRQEMRKNLLLIVHPLSVEITITLKDGNIITVQFFYLTNLHLVTTKAKVRLVNGSIRASNLFAGEDILKELYPGDDGKRSPNIANEYQLKQVGIESFDSSHLGIGYFWAQRVCGLNFVGNSGDSQKVPVTSDIIQEALSSVMSAIKSRLRARSSLCYQLQPLEMGMLPSIPEINKYFPEKIQATTSQWSLLTWEDYKALSFTSHLINSECVTSRDIFYQAYLSRGQARMTIAVAIKNCYPQHAPVFALQATWYETNSQASNNDSIRDIEREVNIFYKELVDKTGSWYNLLSSQVLCLASCFDVLLESSGNSEFPKEKIFLQPVRGRNRARPIKYQHDVGEGTFTQR